MLYLSLSSSGFFTSGRWAFLSYCNLWKLVVLPKRRGNVANDCTKWPPYCDLPNLWGRLAADWILVFPGIYRPNLRGKFGILFTTLSSDALPNLSGRFAAGLRPLSSRNSLSSIGKLLYLLMIDEVMSLKLFGPKYWYSLELEFLWCWRSSLDCAEKKME